MNLNEKLNNEYIGKVVRKDLTKSIKEGANVLLNTIDRIYTKHPYYGHRRVMK